MDWKTRRRMLLAAAALAAAIPLAGIAEARTNHAVVVAVTDYPELPRSTWLAGPRNDALLVREFLTTRSQVRFEPGNVKLLADGVDGGREPTLAAIVETLDDLAGRVAPGDFVYLQFSGHGFQQTAADPSTETDGLDEIFLPKDTGNWDDAIRGMPNALVDDVVGAKLDAIRAAGAFVWVVFDSCHSGTATRAAPGDDVVERKIRPEDIGMPASVLAGGAGTRSLLTREAPVDVGAGGAGAGGLVAFFAAQTNETTPEMPLPAGQEGATKYGLFTYTLFSELGAKPNVTYRQLAQAILQNYGGMNRRSTTPLFEGDLDHPVFGTEIGDYVPQWQIATSESGVTIPAGHLEGLTAGTKLAILERPGDAAGDAIGFAEVRSADTMTSRLAMSGVPESVAKARGNAAAAAPKVRTLSEIPPGAVARVIEQRFDFTLTVARPRAEGATADAAAIVDALLAEIAADRTQPFNLELVDPGAVADVRIAVLAESSIEGAPQGASTHPAIWFLPESGELSIEQGLRPPSIVMESGDRAAVGKAVAEYLSRIYKATNLARISQASDFGPTEIDVTFTLRRPDSGDEVPITTTDVPAGMPGDRVRVSAVNETSGDVDINLLYVGTDYSITWMGNARLKPQARYEREFLEFTDESFGHELVVAVFSEARPLTATQDLRFLEQKGLRQVTRGEGAAGVAQLIEAMGLGGTTRAGKPVGDPGSAAPRGSVMLYPVRTVPRE